ncbi:hypothetical protein [Vibrio lentus]|uniref:Uncharacterized protein n=1 Tax=Vibrio lentus TaxID=136468 RepID=A0AA45A8D9_9VIBR|nr:hypothetical protein [Vibrio lentus]MCB5358379.1 hypothetical protein [Vibrio lentus]MCB5448847.1 hypothetical protein [Vibrio lentus]MCB5460734.1 hypothetical protein [Vibrio lentus]MCC4795990.1 hypothetical protein [Vibrio lentus]MCC4853360.1 hypothetical protein [Vibrio lentus]
MINIKHFETILRGFVLLVIMITLAYFGKQTYQSSHNPNNVHGTWIEDNGPFIKLTPLTSQIEE